jgi:S-adenosylmethionine:tRNA ribosyltransferase-isomerase
VKTELFDYYLPPSLIAQTPIEPRHHSRMLVFNRLKDEIAEDTFIDIRKFLISGDVLVLNKTKVLPARIFGTKSTGGKVEVLLLKKIDYLSWEVLISGKRILKGTKINFKDHIYGKVTNVLDRGGRIIEFSASIEDFMRKEGRMPVPPYIRTDLKDQERYQTVYAEVEGSSAAPTAGLHFSDVLIETLKDEGVIFADIVLHVGLDTFAPVTEDNIEDHKIHSEWCSIEASEAEKINKARKEGRRIIAVGTTSVRTLETLPLKNPTSKDLKAYSGPTDLFIYPGYEFKVVDAMITNFHLPKSSLLMLVSAFAGLKNIKKCYEYAIRENFRFYSFGDVMFIT